MEFSSSVYSNNLSVTLSMIIPLLVTQLASPLQIIAEGRPLLFPFDDKVVHFRVLSCLNTYFILSILC